MGHIKFGVSDKTRGFVYGAGLFWICVQKADSLRNEEEAFNAWVGMLHLLKTCLYTYKRKHIQTKESKILTNTYNFKNFN